MQIPPFPKNENDHLISLCELKVLETPPEPRFDRIKRIAQDLFDVPIALVSLIDADRQWYESIQGLAVADTPSHISFCGYAILQDGIFVVPNASLDQRFADNPLVTGPQNIRFYAGIPLSSTDGMHLGTLCIIDTKPRHFTCEQLDRLTDLAHIAEDELSRQHLNEVTALYRVKQKRLRESENLLRAIADNTPGMLGYWTTELRCAFANKEYLAWFGRTPEQMLGVRIQDLMGDVLFRKNESYIRAALLGEDQQFERELVKKNGEVGYTLARYIAHKTNGVVLGFFVLVIDITSIKLAEKKLRESEAHNQAMISAIPDMIFMHRRDGKILEYHLANQQHSLSVLAPAPHQMIMDILPKPAADLLLKACADALDCQAMQEIYFSVPTTGGKQSYYEVRVAPSAEDKVISIMRDVTDRELDRRNLEFYTTQLSDRLNLSESDVLEKEQILALAADAANLGVWVLDYVKNEFFPSEQWRKLFGFSLSQKIDTSSLWMRMHNEDVSSVFENFFVAISNKSLYENTYRIVLPDGQLRWIYTRGRAEFNEDGQPTVIRGVSVDVTARKQAELSVQQKQNEIIHLSRLSMLGELSGALAHELNQPLTAILSNAQAAQRFLAKENADLVEVREILQDIVDEDKRAGAVIVRLRRLFDKSETQYESVDANELVIDAVRILRNDLINDGIVIRMELLPTSTMISVDRVQMQQVLINLIKNACDAMASRTVPNRLVVVRIFITEESDVQISCIDRGTGIVAADVENIFEAFYTTKQGGMGLGLSICRNIIIANRGRLWGENNADLGASFHVRVPLWPDEG